MDKSDPSVGNVMTVSNRGSNQLPTSDYSVSYMQPQVLEACWSRSHSLAAPGMTSNGPDTAVQSVEFKMPAFVFGHRKAVSQLRPQLRRSCLSDEWRISVADENSPSGWD